MTMIYPVRLDHADDGITITFRDLPEAISAAQSDDEALHNASEVLSLALESRLEAGEPIPEPSAPEEGELFITPDANTQVAVLFRLAREGRSLSDIARAMGTSWAAVQRLENPKHSPTLKQLEKAAAALGKRLVIEFQ
jgi:antitoxin HicB